MNQRLTFTAFLQDEYSKKFDNLANRSDSNIKKIEKDLSKLGKTGKLVTRSIDDLNKRIDVLTRVRRLTIDTRAIKFATQEIKRLQAEKNKLEGIGSSGGSGGYASIFNIAGGIGVANMAGRLVRGAISQAKGSAQAYMNYESIVESFKVLTKDDQLGQGLAERLNKWQQDTILGPEVFKSAQTLLSFGVSINDVEKDLLALGNVSQGNADKLQSLTLAFAQTQSAGRLMGQDLLQYVNAGFNPLQTISDKWQQFGLKSKKTVGELRKDMEQGAISSDMIRKAFEIATTKGGMFDGMLAKIGKTTYGQSKQLEGQYEALKIATGERFKPALDGAFAALSSIVGGLQKMVKIPLSEKIKDQADNLRVLKTELSDTNIAEDRRKEIIMEIQSKYGSYLTNIDLEKDGYKKINEALENTISLLDKKSQKARLNEILKESQDELSNLYKGKSSYINMIYKEYGNKFPDIMNKEGISTEERIRMIQGRMSKKDPLSGGTKASSEDLFYIDSYFGINNDIIKAKKNLQQTTEDVKRQMKDEGLYDVDLDDGKGIGGKSGKGIVTSGNNAGASVPSISGSSKITHLYINIDSLVKGGVNIHSSTVKESAAEMKNIVVENLLTAVNDANLSVGK